MASQTIKIPPIGNFTHGTDMEACIAIDEGNPKPDKLTRLRSLFVKSGTVRSVRAIILAHNRSHPFVLTLQKHDGDKLTVIPGGKLSPGEDDETGLQRLLNKKLQLIGGGRYEINELLANWYRPQFTDQLFPYLPVHVTIPKETERWYLVTLPLRGALRIPQKYTLHAAPFYDLWDGSAIFGKLVPTIPALLSRFTLDPRSETEIE